MLKASDRTNADTGFGGYSGYSAYGIWHMAYGSFHGLVCFFEHSLVYDPYV